MNVYFAGSIKGGRSNVNFYKKALDIISKYGFILNPHLADKKINSNGENKEPSWVYNRDLRLIKKADLLIADVSVPSTGVGYEIALFEKNRKPILCIFNSNICKSPSFMITGNKKLKTVAYSNEEELANRIDSFFYQNKKIKKLREITIEVTNKCSQRCLHCSSEAGKKFNNELSLREIKNLVRDAKKLGSTSVVLSGGDPLLREDIISIVNFIRKSGLAIKLQTTGIYEKKGNFSFISEDFLNFFSKKQNKDDIIVFSVHGLENTHNLITQNKLSFQYIMSSIALTKKHGIKVGIHTVINSLNYKQLKKMKELFDKLKIFDWHILRLVPQGRCIDNSFLNMNISQMKYFQNDLIKMISKNNKLKWLTVSHSIDLRYWNDSEENKPHLCEIGNDRIYVRSDGSVTYCAALKYSNFGNIRKKSLKFFWEEHPFIKRVRRFLRDDVINLKGKCQKCDISKKCRGGCIAQRLYKYNNDLYQGPDPLCYRKYARTNSKN